MSIIPPIPLFVLTISSPSTSTHTTPRTRNETLPLQGNFTFSQKLYSSPQNLNPLDTFTMRIHFISSKSKPGHIRTVEYTDTSFKAWPAGVRPAPQQIKFVTKPKVVSPPQDSPRWSSANVWKVNVNGTYDVNLPTSRRAVHTSSRPFTGTYYRAFICKCWKLLLRFGLCGYQST